MSSNVQKFLEIGFVMTLRDEREKSAMVILFLHGWHSVPGGVKPTYLKDHHHTIINPKLDDDDFDAAVQTAQAECDKHQPQVIAGSSRGGTVAMNIKSGNAKLVLLCPAWKNWGTENTIKPDTIILHSKADEVIPFADSEELVKKSGAMLIEVGNDHRLADPESLSAMLWACEVLASGKSLSDLEEDDFPESKTSDTQNDASYTCDACGEEIVIPLDLTEGVHQTYVEDCPVCCRANTIHVEIDGDGNAKVWAEPEQDRDEAQ